MKDKADHENKGVLTFFPTLLLREVVVCYLVIGVVVTLAVILPVDYGQKADTLITPFMIKAEWYFLWLYQMMKIVPALVGLSITFLLVFGLFVLPFIDRIDSNRIRDRIGIAAIGTLVLLIIVILTVWGAF